MPSLLVPTATHIPINFSKRQSLNLPQFQLYAVEKWLVDRSRQSSLLLVFTGDPNHTVSLDELVTDDDAAWDAAIHAYRRDGAKPKQTQNGVLMVTSLAHFRSDWTIVNIPSGDFATARDQLYANINLLRMGCTGRSALSLGEPSDTTKDRFISLYHLPETSFSPPATGEHPLPPSSSKRFPTVRGKTKDSHTFIPAVLELVKLIQAGLSIFGYYTSPIDGLLCDSTLDAINHWMAEIGEPLLGLEPTERVVDPMFVSALLSLVLAVRNKLATLITLDFSSHQSAASNNTNVTPSPPPKDPFLFPQPFILSLSVYLQATTGTSGSTALTPQIIEAIDAAHESATRRRLKPVRKVLRTKIDDHPHAKVDSEGDEKKEPRERDFYHYNYRSGGEEPSSLPPSTVTSPTTGPSSGRLLALTSLTPSSSTSLAHAGLSSLTTTTSDLASFLTVALTKEKDGDRLGSGPTFTGLHVRAHAQGRRERRRRMGASVSVIPDAPSGSLRSKTRESVDLGHFYHAASGDPSSSTEGITNTRLLDTVVAGSVKALWSGRVAELVRLRELANSPSAQWQDPPALLTPSLSLRVPSGGSALSASSSWSKARSKGKSKTSLNQASVSNVNVHSDGDVNTSKDGNLKSETDDDSEGLYAPNASQTTFGSLLGGKVKGKLGTWTAMAKRRARGEGGSVDLTSTGIPQSVRSAPCSVGVSPAVSQDGSGGGSASGAPQVPTVIEDDEGDESRMSKGQIKHLNLPGPRKPKPSRIATAPSAISGRNRSGSIAGVLTIGGSANASSGPQSPTLPPMVYAPGEPPEDEGELLSSGQISPLSQFLSPSDSILFTYRDA
ncbi:hypothetical protein CC1G_14634 [Coprinopsis cinerea okayama7|uniref:STB6-like N-terminal domain-containing protein n=1 Tax=Coprinopsis cinerea (strain Okayama-7 / 130 / ATCC MYA-4618 / FGSC 9003) TaxID=240176 RepID=D6RMW2_COPC7|nr:hypothetical protein CC1G_14634 [Coprinopsis cinerea okayama7\|eukprot:XP_002911203.1 hypothetical protein CC1G_14634 [Coprinopsis cinerea okayama7\